MILQSLDVKDILPVVQPGDILAFSGKGNIISDLVRAATGSIVSHVGIVLNSQTAAMQPRIIESTSLGGFSGVTVTDLAMRVSYYPGLIWYLPLSSDNQKKADSAKLEYWLLQQKGKQYDTWGAVESALLEWEQSDYWRKISSHLPSFFSHAEQKPVTEWFCSELASAALQQVGVIPDSLNPDLIRPTDLVGLQIYSGTYYQIKPTGDKTAIPEYNSSPLESEAIFQKALVSKKPDVIYEVGRTFESLGITNKATALYKRSMELETSKRKVILIGAGVLAALYVLGRYIPWNMMFRRMTP